MAIHNDMLESLSVLKDTFKTISGGIYNAKHKDASFSERTSSKYICSITNSTTIINGEMKNVIDAMINTSRFRNSKVDSEIINIHLFDVANAAIINLSHRCKDVEFINSDVKSIQTYFVTPYSEDDYECIKGCIERIYNECYENVGQINRIYPMMVNDEIHTLIEAIKVYANYMNNVVDILKDCTERSVITK